MWSLTHRIVSERRREPLRRGRKFRPAPHHTHTGTPSARDSTSWGHCRHPWRLCAATVFKCPRCQPRFKPEQYFWGNVSWLPLAGIVSALSRPCRPFRKLCLTTELPQDASRPGASGRSPSDGRAMLRPESAFGPAAFEKAERARETPRCSLADRVHVRLEPLLSPSSNVESFRPPTAVRTFAVPDAPAGGRSSRGHVTCVGRMMPPPQVYVCCRPVM